MYNNDLEELGNVTNIGTLTGNSTEQNKSFTVDLRQYKCICIEYLYLNLNTVYSINLPTTLFYAHNSIDISINGTTYANINQTSIGGFNIHATDKVTSNFTITVWGVK